MYHLIDEAIRQRQDQRMPVNYLFILAKLISLEYYQAEFCIYVLKSVMEHRQIVYMTIILWIIKYIISQTYNLNNVVMMFIYTEKKKKCAIYSRKSKSTQYHKTLQSC